MKRVIVCFVVLIFGSSMQASLQLTSSAFVHDENIPSKYTCDGENVSPALAWSGAPENTKSFVLIVDDPDAPSKVWVHWIVFNIPSQVGSLEEGTSTNSFVCGATDFSGALSYGGPCPPTGEHRYHFTLYALDIMLSSSAGITKESLCGLMKSHILDKTTLIGRYSRQK